VVPGGLLVINMAGKSVNDPSIYPPRDPLVVRIPREYLFGNQARGAPVRNSD